MLVTNHRPFSPLSSPTYPSSSVPVPPPPAPAPSCPPAPFPPGRPEPELRPACCAEPPAPPGRWPWRCGTCGLSSCAAPACSSRSPRNVSSWREPRRLPSPPRWALLYLLPSPGSGPSPIHSWARSVQEIPRKLGTSGENRMEGAGCVSTTDRGQGRAGELSAPRRAGLALDPPPRASSVLIPGLPPTLHSLRGVAAQGCPQGSTSLCKGLDSSLALTSDLGNLILSP